MNPTPPKIGQRGTFHHGGSTTPESAEVLHVWSDTCVNVKTASGHLQTSVFVPRGEPGERVPSGYYFVPDPVRTGSTLQDGDDVAPDSADPQPQEVTVRIQGYRQLGTLEQDLINEGKALAEQVGAFVAKLRAHGDTARGCASLKDSELAPSPLLLDQRWISLGATDLQRGFMALTRGIAQPTGF